MKKIIPLFFLVTACVTPLSKVPPVYGCEGLTEFGCPDSKPADDPEPGPQDLIPQ